MSMSDNTKGRLIVAGFFLGLPLIYLSPVIVNAITDLVIKLTG